LEILGAEFNAWFSKTLPKSIGTEDFGWLLRHERYEHLETEDISDFFHVLFPKVKTLYSGNQPFPFVYPVNFEFFFFTAKKKSFPKMECKYMQ